MRLSIRTTRYVFVLIFLASISFIVAALTLAEAARLHPCYLCNFQRLLYLMLALFALCGALMPGRSRIWSALLALTAAGGVATAAYQSWMQYAPQEAIECGFGNPTLLERIVDWFAVQWPSMFMVTGFCTNKEWVFLGLSLANWSLFCFLGFLCLAVRLWINCCTADA